MKPCKGLHSLPSGVLIDEHAVLQQTACLLSHGGMTYLGHVTLDFYC